MQGDTFTMELEITLRVNGVAHQLSVDTRTTLLDALRERLGHTSSKKGGDHGQCGARAQEVHRRARGGRRVHGERGVPINAI